MTNASNSPLLKAAPLWSKTSVKGGWYLTGRFGGVKILVMENRDRQGDDDPSHILYFTKASDRRQGAQQGAHERGDGAAAPPAGQRLSGDRRRSFQGHQAPLNADLDDAPEWAR
jgi:hypothetical protein